jgi:sugar/nucleoside kinase (ribokinase family)
VADALVIGSVALDTVETPLGTVEDILGGSAAYGSVSASYFTRTELVAVVGSDFPKRYVKMFRERDIDVSGLEYADGLTFRWSGYYSRDYSSRTTNTTSLNVFEHFHPKLSEANAKAKYVFLANIHPELQLHVLNQLRNPELVALDTMNFWIEGFKRELTQVMRRVSVLLLNEEEAKQYCETTNLIEAGNALVKMGPRTVIIKKGEHGSLVFQNGQIMAVPAYPLAKLKDPTGAGDTFAGALVGYLARLGKVTDENVRRAAVVGSIMASFVVEDFSLKRLARLRTGELEARVNELVGMTTVPKFSQKTLVERGPEAPAKPAKPAKAKGAKAKPSGGRAKK